VYPVLVRVYLSPSTRIPCPGARIPI